MPDARSCVQRGPQHGRVCAAAVPIRMQSPSTSIALPPEPVTEPPRLLHHDAACVVVCKPAGQPSVPGRGALANGSSVQQVQLRWPDALTVHRLDMATSGVLLFARGAQAQRGFSRLFELRRVDKRYVALVQGRVDAAVGAGGEIDLPLAADWPNRPRQVVDRAAGRPSLTRWRVIEHDPAGRWTRLELIPITGRSHQLRVHLLALGHPIVGDRLYGPPDGAPRLMLHARSLRCSHPLDGSELAVESPVPF